MPQNALNAPDCISAHIHLKKFPAPPKKLVAFGHSGLLPQTINPRLNPDPGIFEIDTFLHESVFRPHETSESRHRERIFLKPLSMQSGLRPRPQEAG